MHSTQSVRRSGHIRVRACDERRHRPPHEAVVRDHSARWRAAAAAAAEAASPTCAVTTRIWIFLCALKARRTCHIRKVLA